MTFKEAFPNCDFVNKGLVIRADFPDLPLDEFAKVVLTFTNTKSNRYEGLVDLRTYPETNIIDLCFDVEDVTEEEAMKFVEYVCLKHASRKEYIINVIGDIKIISITHLMLEEKGIITDEEDFMVNKI